MEQSPFTHAELKRILDDNAEVAGYLWQKGWAERNAGNISVNVTGVMPGDTGDLNRFPFQSLEHAYPGLSGCYFLVTGTQSRMRDLCGKPSENVCLIRVSKGGDGYHILWSSESSSRPTSELNSHLGIHQLLRRKNAPQRAILHTHPNELIALTHLPTYNEEKALNRLLWSMHPETKIVLPEGVGLVPYQVPGSSELEQATVKALDTHRVAVWEKHGSVAVGVDVFEAFDLIDTISKSAHLFFLCQAAGSVPEGLTDLQVDELDQIFCHRAEDTG